MTEFGVLHAFMAHVVRMWSSYSRRKKANQIYLEAQTEQKYAIWFSCYLNVEILIVYNVNR